MKLPAEVKVQRVEVVPVDQAACEVIPLERHAATAAIPMVAAKIRSPTEGGNCLDQAASR